MKKISANDPRIISEQNRIKETFVKDVDGRFIGTAKNKSGYLYVISSTDSDYAIQITLPDSLWDYANKAAGTMPHADGGKRPVGIRTGSFKTAEVAADYIASIVDDASEFAKLLNNSECDSNYVPTGSVTVSRKKGKVSVYSLSKTDNEQARDGIYNKYGDKAYKILVGIANTHGISRDRAIELLDFLTINEYELMFGRREYNFDLSVYNQQ